LRLYGNIFAGEVLLALIGTVAKSFGLVSFVVAIPVEMIWQGFSVFIGAIQAYVFTTLSMVYISRKMEKE
jgi:F0F1-type ATP synthase, subunit a